MLTVTTVNALCFGAVFASAITVMITHLLICRLVPFVDTKLSSVLNAVHLMLGILVSLFFLYDEAGGVQDGIEWWMPVIATTVYLAYGVISISQIVSNRVTISA